MAAQVAKHVLARELAARCLAHGGDDRRVDFRQQPRAWIEPGRRCLDEPQHELGAVLRRKQRSRRLRRHLARKVCPRRHIRQVRADEIEHARQRLEKIPTREMHSVSEPVLGHVASGDVEGVATDVARPYLNLWCVVGDRDGDAATAGAGISDS